MKQTALSLLLFLFLSPTALFSQQARPWEDHHVLGINREPARSWFMPFSVRKGDEQLSLDGIWRFHWSPTPEGKVSDFFSTDFDSHGWDQLSVPANWETNGYGTPIYVSAGYPFRIDPPRVMTEPPHDYTTYAERNPTGQYLRTFRLPDEWCSAGQVFLRFDGVQSAFFVWVNGRQVGYSQGSMEPSEFNITSLVNAGENRIAVEVYKYSDGSYLEDQDFWRLGGIQRSVTLYHTPNVQIRDLGVRTVPVDTAGFLRGNDDFWLQIHPAIRAFAPDSARGCRLKAVLTDDQGQEVGTTTADAYRIYNPEHRASVMNALVPQRGRSQFDLMSMRVRSPRQWTAETPSLYRLRLVLTDSLGHVLQQVEQQVGFRWIAIRNGRFLVNGRPVRFRGVNRHEHHPLLGRVTTEADMLRDIKLMKGANINAVRTCHYPDNPRWYELCDSLGLYVLDEADCETHGLRGTLTSDPDWNQAFVDRMVRMVERDRNFPCIVMWSLGNESGFGVNHATMAGMAREMDPTRPIHYEGAQTPYFQQPDSTVRNGQAWTEQTFPYTDPLCVDVMARFYPRVCQDYLNPGIPEGSTAERAENARWEHLLLIAQRTNDQRPVVTSEYAHAMGNALGNLRDYWDEIYSNPRLLGGFIWEWADQGLYAGIRQKANQSSDKRIFYGGDFGDKPNLGVFCLKGVVDAERQKGTKYQEVKAVYAPVQLSVHNGTVWVVNRYDHLSLATVTCQFEVTQNGRVVQRGRLDMPQVEPGDSARLCALSTFKSDAKKDTRVLLRFSDAAGNEIVSHQLTVNDRLMEAAAQLGKRPKSSVGDWDELKKAARLHVFRAPTDNDKGFGNWLAKDWKVNRLDSPEVRVVNDSTTDYVFAKGKITVVTTLSPGLTNGRKDGSMLVSYRFHFNGELPELPCLGVTYELPKRFSQVSWYGRGPWDSYPDRKETAHIGLWRSTVAQEYVHFPHPQDCGNHEDCSLVVLSDDEGHEWRMEAVDAPFSFSALPFSANEIAGSRHDWQLPDSRATHLTIDLDVLGLGNGSCGPGVLKKYAIDKSHDRVLRFRVFRR
jgi:beta-galactosidase